MLSHQEVTGLATPSDVRLLRLVIRAEQKRHELDRGSAAAALDDEPAYSSPFINIPI